MGLFQEGICRSALTAALLLSKWSEAGWEGGECVGQERHIPYRCTKPLDPDKAYPLGTALSRRTQQEKYAGTKIIKYIIKYIHIYYFRIHHKMFTRALFTFDGIGREDGGWGWNPGIAELIWKQAGINSGQQAQSGEAGALWPLCGKLRLELQRAVGGHDLHPQQLKDTVRLCRGMFNHNRRKKSDRCNGSAFFWGGWWCLKPFSPWAFSSDSVHQTSLASRVFWGMCFCTYCQGTQNEQ